MKYDDILYLEHPVSKKHPSMSLNDRAKIFLPFAALKGYEQVIASKQKKEIKKIELDQDALEELDEKLNYIQNHLPIEITILYFLMDHYESIHGNCSRIDLSKNEIYLDNQILSLQNILEIDI